MMRVVSGMMALTLVGQGLYVIAAPFIGRLYTPVEVGYFGLFITIVSTLGLFACGLYDLAIPTAKDEAEAESLSVVCIIFGIGLGILSGLIFATIAASSVFSNFNLPAWSGVLVFFAIVAQSWVILGQGWAIRKGRVLAIGQSHVLMHASRSLLQVAGGLVLPLWPVLAAGEIVSRCIQAGHMAIGGLTARIIQFDARRMLCVIRANRRYPMIFGPAFILDSIGFLVQTAMLGALFGAVEMGQYFLMKRTLDLPVAFAFRSLSDAFFERQIVLARDESKKLVMFFIKSAMGLAILGGLVFSPLIFWGRELFILFYGPAWGLAGLLAAIMVAPTVLNLAVAPVARVFQLSNWSQLRLVPSLISFLGSIILFIAAKHYNLSFIESVTGIAIVIFLQYIGYFFSGLAASRRIAPF